MPNNEMFAAPATQLLNEFLRSERGFSASRISLFTILTNSKPERGAPAHMGARVRQFLATRLKPAGTSRR